MRAWGHAALADIVEELLAGRPVQRAPHDLSGFSAEELVLFRLDPETQPEPDYGETEEALSELLDALTTTALDRLPEQGWASELPLPRRVERQRRRALRSTPENPAALADAIQRFLAFTQHAEPELVAKACHDQSDRRRFACAHQLHLPEPRSAAPMLARVEHPPNREALSRFFAHCSAAELFVVDGVAGLVIAPPAAWPSMLEEVTDWWIEAEDEMSADELVVLRNAIPLARIEQAATWFLLVESGPLAGKIVMFSHDGLEVSEPIAEHLADFLDRIPKQAIRWIAPDVRYVQPGSDQQYFPVVYRAEKG